MAGVTTEEPPVSIFASMAAMSTWALNSPMARAIFRSLWGRMREGTSRTRIAVV